MENEKEALLASLEAARAQLDHALEKISSQAEIYPSWKVKHLLDHVTGWDELVASAFQVHTLGGTPEKVVHGIDRYNAQSVEERKELTEAQSRQAYADARTALIRAVREMPAERLTLKFHAPWGGSCSVQDAVKIFANHELEHARQIEEGLESPDL
jgi:hypothetical protein